MNMNTHAPVPIAPDRREREGTFRQSARAEEIRCGTPSDQPSTSQPSPIRVAFHILLLILGMAVALWTLHRLASVLLVLTMAALLAYVIAPLVQVAEHPIRIAGRSRRLSRGTAIALVYLLLGGTVAGGVALLL